MTNSTIADPDSAEQIPKGFALVPVKATEAMLQEAFYSMTCPVSGSIDPQNVWTAMLAAAPSAANAPPADLPATLFDGYSVYKALSKAAEKRTSYDNVSDVLDAVAKLMRAQPADPDSARRSQPAPTTIEGGKS